MNDFGVLDQLQPKNVFQYFEEICAIPHGSYNCKAISDYLVQFAKERGLYVRQDENLNVIIKKEASPSCVKKQPIILQGHMDMVCQKEPDCDIDFTKDGLDLQVDGDFISAKGTTLGGDDGIAVAYCLALLDDDRLNHPPLEVVITTEEEVGMEGANGLDVFDLEGKHIINIDSEDEGILLAACAGGANVKVALPISFEKKQGTYYQISLDGLSGGHSGTEIDKGLGNAHKMMGQLLGSLSDVSIAKIWGAKEQKDNAIPNECYAIVSCSEDQLIEMIQEYTTSWKTEYNDEFSLSYKRLPEDSYEVFTNDTKESVLDFLNKVPNGIHTMSQELEGLVESSLNLGVLIQEENRMTFSFGVRSAVVSYKEEIISIIDKLAKANDGSMERNSDYPAWEYKKDSKLRETFVNAYRELYGEEMKVESIHAGLECGIFASKIADVDIVAFGPNIYDIHTVKERMSIESVRRTWELLLKVIEEFP